MGTSRKRPRPKTATSRVVSKAGKEISSAVSYGTSWALPSPALPMAMLAATGASPSPMDMITGPTTTGGSSRSIS